MTLGKPVAILETVGLRMSEGGSSKLALTLRDSDQWKREIWEQAVTAGRCASRARDKGLWGYQGGNTCFYLVSREVESLTERASERMLSFSLIRAGCWVFVRQISPEGSELPSARFPPLTSPEK